MRVLVDFTARMAGNPGGRNYALYMLPLWDEEPSDEVTALFTRGNVPEPLRGLDSVQEVELTTNHAAIQRLLSLHVRVPQVAQREAFDVVYCPGNVSPALLPARLPLVVSVRSTLHYHYGFNFSQVRRTYLRLSDRHSVRAARRIIVPSSGIADDLMRFAGANRDKLVVIPHGVDLEHFKPSTARRDPNLFLFVSAPWDYKGLATVFRALKSVSIELGSTSPPTLVVAAGGVPDSRMRVVRELVDRIGVGPFVKIRSEIPHAELGALYAKASGLILPSSQESFGNAYLEAAAAGCPIVTGANSLSESIRPVAIEVPAHSHEALAKAMSELVNLSDDERRRRERALRAWAERFPWSRTLHQTRDVLAEVA